MLNTLGDLFQKDRPSPSYPQLPELLAHGESTISGLFLAGDVAGRSLIKVGLNDGFDLGEHLSEKLLPQKKGPGEYDVIVVGTGVAGAATGLRLHEKGHRVLCLDSGRIFQTLRTFTKGKRMLAEPEDLPLKGSLPFQESSIEETLGALDNAWANAGVPTSEFTRVTDIRKTDTGFQVISERGEFTASYVVLSIGKAGNPRKAGVPGELEYPEKISHFLKDPDEFKDRKILIYGGGDVAAEAALALCDRNDVVLAAIDETLVFPKKKNVDALNEKAKQGRLTMALNTRLKTVEQDHVVLETLKAGTENRLANDVVFEMIGAEAPTGFFKTVGIRLEKAWTLRKSLILLFTSILCLVIYTWKKGYFPFHYYGEGLSRFHGIFKNPSFWYSWIYTLLMIVFGLKAMKRWSRNWTDTYQIARFSSLILFQVFSFVLIECLFAIYLPGDTWWRVYAVTNPFPLLFDSFYNLSGVTAFELKWIIAVLALVVTFVVIPLAVRNHGKRFCSWICGCGGLAETLGDRWRHLSPKGEKSRRWEFMGDLVLFWAAISALVILVVYGGNIEASGLWHSAYAVIADFWLIAVIPVALYPIMGGKIWCRYWCPLAKYMELLSRRYGRLTITANDKCIQCTQCSVQCQVGVDVMAFAKNAQAFSNKETSCIHCGICITVCPMDVLSFTLK
ncbi:MAG: NAD(P)-binding domain-containing protein [Proteobacteria bacterium]|nr:NAD(P)-binding domain-containing protein [Pseudomonadota bacterium]